MNKRIFVLNNAKRYMIIMLKFQKEDIRITKKGWTWKQQVYHHIEESLELIVKVGFMIFSECHFENALESIQLLQLTHSLVEFEICFCKKLKFINSIIMTQFIRSFYIAYTLSHSFQLIFNYISMNNQQDFREQFLKSQLSVGITKQNYARRFLFDNNQTSDNYLLDRLSVSPSQLHGFTIDQQKNISHLMSQMIFRAGESLKLPVSTTIVAVSIAHYFFSRRSFLDYDFRDVAMGATFLACKSEETLRKTYEVSAVFDYIFKIFQGQRMPIKVQILNSVEYDFMKAKVIKMENQILFQLGFEVYRLFDIPHRYIGGLFKSFDRHPQSKQICQKAWIFLNDFYRTSNCLYYSGQVIASAAIYLSLLKLNVKMPSVPWWVLMQSNLQNIEELIGQLQTFYESSTVQRYNLDWISAQINQIGEKHSLVNVFPVNYYRKIMLEQNNQIKLKKQIQQITILHQKETIHQEKLHEIGSNTPDYKNQKKKKKKDKRIKDKKDKKRKKDKYKRKRSNSESSQSKSRSRSKDKSDKRYSSRSPSSQKNPQHIRNNQETPKIVKQQTQMNNQSIIEQRGQDQKKQVVKQMQIGNAKGLLSMISNQLKKHQGRKKQQQQENEDNSDQELLAELIKIKKSNAQKSNQSNV